MNEINNLEDVRKALAEVAEIAWKDKAFLPRATVVTNSLGKIISSVAVEIKAAELSKKPLNSEWLTMTEKDKGGEELI